MIGDIPADRWDAQRLYNPDPTKSGKMVTKWGGFLDDVAGFDWRAFGIPPREARNMDPQHRLLLEVAWEALDDAGTPFEAISGSRGAVVVGITTNDYGKLYGRNLDAIDGYTIPTNLACFAPNRISYFFNLTGPSLAIDTACSSSAMAIHTACREVWSGEADFALAAGVSLILTPDAHISMSKAGALSPTGRSRTLDAHADGFVRTEGAAVVVIKPLGQAVANGDRIYATILGSATTHCGRSDWIMAPVAAAQEEAISRACRVAGVDPRDIDYVELHGTGTIKGDPIEASAVGSVVGAGRDSRDPCVVGSVKTNIGHLDAAAGICGVLKAALSLHHGEIPKSLHFESRNPAIDLDELGLEVATTHRPWPHSGENRLASVNSLGFGGVNVHIVLGGHEASPPEPAREARGATNQADGDEALLLLLSARSEPALSELIGAYPRFLRSTESSAQDVCYTAAVRRTHHDFRAAVTGSTLEELAQKLQANSERAPRSEVTTGRRQRNRKRDVVFVFPGHGTQWVGMGRELLSREPLFRAVVGQCDVLARRHVGWSILEELHAPPESSRLERADVVQPVIFAVEVALAALWRSWGIEPDVVIGHSMGEIAAAHVAGSLTLEDAVRIVCIRGELTRRCAGAGGVAYVEMPAAELAPLLSPWEPHLCLAGENSPSAALVSGDLAELRDFIEKMGADRVFCRQVKLAYASHSHHMDPLLGEFRERIGDVAVKPGHARFCSTVDATTVFGESLGAEYWVRNLRSPVRFAAAIRSIADAQIYLEVSPHPILLTAIEQVVSAEGRSATTVPSLRRGKDESLTLMSSLGRLYAAGCDVGPTPFERGARRCISLPMYPWQRQRLWMDVDSPVVEVEQPAGTHPLLGPHIEVADPPTHIWRRRIRPEQLSYIADHCVGGHPVAPASVFIEMMTAAASDALGTDAIELTELEFDRALGLPEGGVDLEVVLSESPSGSKMSVLGRVGDAWIRHARARVARVVDVSSFERMDLDELRGRAPHEVSRQQCYGDLQSLGIVYGRSFQGVARFWRGDGESLAQVDEPEELTQTRGDYRFHPAFQDACLHSALLSLELDEDNSGVIPVRIERLVVLGGAARRMWSHTRRRGPRMLDVCVADEAGQPVLIAEGICVRFLDSNDVRPIVPEQDWCYELGWQRLHAPNEPTSSKLTGNWLILGDRGGLGSALVERLKAHGVETLLLEVGQGEHSLDAASFDDLWETWTRRFGPDTPCSRIVYLWGLEAVDPSEAALERVIDDVDNVGCGAVLRLLRHVHGTDHAGAPDLWIVTRGAQVVHRRDDRTHAAQASLWGLGRSIGQELPEGWGGLVDLDPAEGVEDSASSLLAVFASAISEDQIAVRGGATHGARLVRRRAELATHHGMPPLRSDATYLVTGGLGGLGLVTARWLVERGARRLVLASRRGLPPRDAWEDILGGEGPVANQVRAVLELEARGAAIDPVALDVAVPEQLEAFLAQHRRDHYPPIRV